MTGETHRVHGLLRLIFLVACVAYAQAVDAQDCGTWPRPVLCEAQLMAVPAGAKAERVDGQSRVRLAPRGQLDLVLEGKDQRGRRFPDEYLMLGYQGEGCGRLLQVESRGRGLRLNAGAEAGRCRVEVWVPGNLNFAWQVDVEVDPGARTSYSRRDAEAVVRALYRAVLQREADGESQRAAVAEVQQGNLDALVASMLRSQEFGERRERLSAEALLDAFYAGIFNRPADTGGVREYLSLVRAGRHSEVLLRMIRSPEFERKLPG